jgi:hypothetical protein
MHWIDKVASLGDIGRKCGRFRAESAIVVKAG